MISIHAQKRLKALLDTGPSLGHFLVNFYNLLGSLKGSRR